MATTKKSTKAKTKTAAAKTAKPAAKRASAKTTKKTTTVKATPVVAPAANTLRSLNILSLLSSLALAVGAVLLMGRQTYEVVMGLMTKNELVSASSAPFASAIHHLFDLEIRWAVVTVLVLGAIVPLLVLTTRKDRYAAAVRAKVNSLRWVEIAVLSALMVEVTALLSGINELFTLKLLSGFMIVTAALGWIAEKRNTQANRPVRSELLLNVVTGVMPWLIIGSYAVGTYAYGLIRTPWYVYALYVALIVGFTAYCLNLKAWVKGKIVSYEIAERNYLTISILTKVAFAVILIAGLQK